MEQKKFVDAEGVKQIGREVAKVARSKQSKLVNSEDVTVGADSKLSVSDKAKREVFNDMWRAIGGTVGTGSTPYVMGTRSRSYEQAVERYSIDSIVQRASLYNITFNENTDYFELNGLTDLTAEDVSNILEYGVLNFHQPCPLSNPNSSINIRTNILISNSADLARSYFNGRNVAYDNITIETLYLGEIRTNDYNYIASPRSIVGFCSNCINLVEIIGTINLDLVDSVTSEEFCKNCNKLTTIDLHRLKFSLNLKRAPALSLWSFQNMIQFATNTTPITITVHPTIYAKLTDESNTEWHALVNLAANKNIQFATTN